MLFYFSRDARSVGDNFSRYSNDEFELLWQQIKTELDPGRRMKLIMEIEQHLMRELPAVPLVNLASHVVSREELTNLLIRVVAPTVTLFSLAQARLR